MNILITDKDWGGCHLDIDFKKIDLLPRITLSDFTGCLILNVGFLMLTFNLCIFSSDMREFNRKLKSGEIKKEMEELEEKMKEMLTEEKSEQPQ